MQRSPRILPRLEDPAGQVADSGRAISQCGQIAWMHPRDLADEAVVAFSSWSYIQGRSSARNFTFRF